jgi:hypothetical protein
LINDESEQFTSKMNCFNSEHLKVALHN